MRRVHLTQFLIERQRDKKLINADLRLLIETVARACKAISTRVNKGALGDGLGGTATRNVHGEVQKKLDVLSNEILLEANEWGGNLAALASEEMENPRPIPTHSAMSVLCVGNQTKYSPAVVTISDSRATTGDRRYSVQAYSRIPASRTERMTCAIIDRACAQTDRAE